MKRRRFLCHSLSAILIAATSLSASLAAADEVAPDETIKRLLTDVIDTVKNDKAARAGDNSKLAGFVDSKIMPFVNFPRMTAAVVGPAWRQATPDQQRRLQEEFKTLLVTVYAGALSQLKDKTVTVKPLKGSPNDKEVLVRAELKGAGEVINLDYRLEKPTDSGWKIYNLNVMGVWLSETYRSQFAQELNASGIDGLINSLSERNKSNRKKA